MALPPLRDNFFTTPHMNIERRDSEMPDIRVDIRDAIGFFRLDRISETLRAHGGTPEAMIAFYTATATDPSASFKDRDKAWQAIYRLIEKSLAISGTMIEAEATRPRDDGGIERVTRRAISLPEGRDYGNVQGAIVRPPAEEQRRPERPADAEGPVDPDEPKES